MKFLFLIVILIGCGSRNSGSSSELRNGDLDAIICDFENELQTDLNNDGIDGSISGAIVHGDVIIWSKAFGYADKEHKVLADTSTIYRTGSISKSFTAFLMMVLVDEGLIKLNDPVDLYFPEIRNLQGYSDTNRITFSQLASHTAGLPREPELEDANVGQIEKWEEKILLSIPTTFMESIPGTKYSYSNIGFGILGLALSRVAKKPFMILVQEKIFEPLKMTRSFYVVPEDLKMDLATGMEGGPGGTIDMESPREEHTGRGYKVPNGGIYSTPSDLAKFMINNLGFSPILEMQSLEAMQTENGPVPNKYGLGFMIFHNEQVSVVGHNGQVLGYTAEFVFEKESKFGVILMRNYTWGATELDKTSFVLLNRLKQLKME